MFTVIWTPEAVAELTTIWERADSRTHQRITAAIRQIDSLLRRSPHQAGESRELANLRVVVAAPVGVEFYISADDLRVDITRVWRFQEHR